MLRFKVGDKVKIVAFHDNAYEPSLIGKSFTVAMVNKQLRYPYTLVVSNEKCVVVADKELELEHIDNFNHEWKRLISE